jgi:hypothetical protein
MITPAISRSRLRCRPMTSQLCRLPIHESCSRDIRLLQAIGSSQYEIRGIAMATACSGSDSLGQVLSCGFLPQGLTSVAWACEASFWLILSSRTRIAIPCGSTACEALTPSKVMPLGLRICPLGFTTLGQRNYHITQRQEAEYKLYHKCWLDSSVA